METQNTEVATQLPAGTWTLDPARSTVTITAKKLGVITVPATLTVTSSSIEIGADHEVTAVEVVVDAASYTSSNDKRDEHVRSADFLDAEAHPEIVFRSGPLTGLQADGTVTIKGGTYPVSVTVDQVVVDGESATFAATATVDRNSMGVDKLPSLVISRALQLSVSATAVRSES